jgi:hypothetical protein
MVQLVPATPVAEAEEPVLSIWSGNVYDAITSSANVTCATNASINSVKIFFIVVIVFGV